jgi:hypothetical protein
MNVRTHRIGVLALVAALIPCLVYAQERLDNRTIGRWADSMEELQAWADQQDDSDDEMFEEVDDPMDFEFAFAKAVRENAEIRRIIGRHGFNDGDRWARTGGRIMNAYSAMRMDEESPGLQRDMQRQIDEIERNPNLSREEKNMMQDQMRQAMGMMNRAADAPPEDVAAVRAHRDRLNRLFEEE